MISYCAMSNYFTQIPIMNHSSFLNTHEEDVLKILRYVHLVL